MTWYVVYRADGSKQSTGQAKPDDAKIASEGWFVKSFDYNIQARDKEWNTVTLTFDTVAVPKDRITVDSFKGRFTDAEYITVIALAKTNDQVAAYMDRINTKQVIDLEDAGLIKFMTFLTKPAAGDILSVARAQEILN